MVVVGIAKRLAKEENERSKEILAELRALAEFEPVGLNTTNGSSEPFVVKTREIDW